MVGGISWLSWFMILWSEMWRLTNCCRTLFDLITKGTEYAGVRSRFTIVQKTETTFVRSHDCFTGDYWTEWFESGYRGR
jgi:hypothetical protein